MAQIGIRELLEAGVHFGHQTRRWNPKMRRFIHGESGGIYVIDLLKTERLLRDAQEFASAVAHRGGTVLFVGTKKQARDAVKETAEKSGMPYVNHRWLGGLLTNFQTINQRIRRLHDLERYEAEGQLELLPTRERMGALADLAKLRANLGGVKNMQRPPNAMVVIDLKVEEIAVREAQRLRIPIIGLVDTNCDPDGIEFVIPGNDDAIRSCALITSAIGDVVGEGAAVFRAQEEQARKEAEEQAAREAAERARKDAEEQAAREAAELAQREAAAEAAKTQAEGGGDRAVAEAQVAEAVQAEGRPQPDPKVPQAANTAVAPVAADRVGGESPDPAPPVDDTPPAAAAVPPPAAEAPAAETPPVETPAAEAPAAEAPAAATPPTEAPAAEAPAAEAPVEAPADPQAAAKPAKKAPRRRKPKPAPDPEPAAAEVPAETATEPAPAAEQPAAADAAPDTPAAEAPAQAPATPAAEAPEAEEAAQPEPEAAT